MIDLLLPLRCPCCGERSDGPCRACCATFAAAPVLPPIASLLEVRCVHAYEGGVRHVVLAAKAQRCHALIGHMAASMSEHLDGHADCVLTWVATAPARVRERGFDHAALLAHAVGRKTGLPVESLLRRVGGAQEGRGRRSRAAVAFTARAPRNPSHGPAPGRAVVVLDDVRTTGASLAAAADALHRVGWTDVAGLTYAATPLPGTQADRRSPSAVLGRRREVHGV